MGLDILDRKIRQAAEKYLAQLESDVIFFYGEIFPESKRFVVDNPLIGAQERSLLHAWDDEYDDVWESVPTT